jgi:beta-aspartyl-peptidase (threonine type)
MGQGTVAIVVHGGAWSIPLEAREPHARGCLAAAERGFAVLESAGSAVDAVVAAIELLEDDPTFDAGRGSVLSAEGRVQLDAGLMDGRTLHVGAVAGLHRVEHPIRLARAVLERSSHHLLVGEGAEGFAREQGFALVDPDSLVVDRERQRYADFLAGWLGTADDFAHDTVGAVALDARGQIAAGNSTGGVAFSLPGRVGDAPLPGVGYVADSRTGGVACTGWGEHILRVGLATRALVAMERGAPAQEAASEALGVLERSVHGRAGLIVLDRDGAIGLAHSTLCLAHAYRRSGMPAAVGGTEAPGPPFTSSSPTPPRPSTR